MKTYTAKELISILLDLTEKVNTDPFIGHDQRKTALETIKTVKDKLGLSDVPSTHQGAVVKTMRECNEKLVYYHAKQAIKMVAGFTDEEADRALRAGFVASSDPKIVERLNHSFEFHIQRSEGCVGSAFARGWRFASLD